MVLFRNGTDTNRFRTRFFLSFLTCKRSFSFWNRSVSFFPEPVVLVHLLFTVNLMRFIPSCALHLRGNMADKKKKASPRKAATKAVETWKGYEVEMLLVTLF